MYTFAKDKFDRSGSHNRYLTIASLNMEQLLKIVGYTNKLGFLEKKKIPSEKK